MGILNKLWPFKTQAYHSHGMDAGFDKTPKQWALLTTSILSEINGTYHDIPGGMKPSPRIKKGITSNLEGAWGISTREDLIEMLQWLKETGHRSEFDMSMSEIIDLGPEQIITDLNSLKSKIISGPDKHIKEQLLHYSYKYEIALKDKTFLEEKGVLAWDLGRYIFLCQWGFLAEYLTEDETWELILEQACVLQNHYGSWEELGKSYLMGRGLWEYDSDDMESYGHEYNKLLKDKNSPWNQVPWDLSF